MDGERRNAVAHAASEARFRSIFENTAVALIERDASGLATFLSELRERDGGDAALVKPSRELIERIFAALPVVDANPAALALFGASSKEALAASWREALLPETLDVFVRAVRAAAAGDETFEAEVPVRTLSGARRDLVVSFALPRPPTFGRVLVSLVDVTERKRAQQIMLDARRAHEAAAHAATEAERRRMARELHDGALQDLTALKLVLEAESKQHAPDALELAVRRTGAIIQEVRAVVEDLRPPELARGSLPDAISMHARVLATERSVALVCELQASVRLPDWVARRSVSDRARSHRQRRSTRASAPAGGPLVAGIAGDRLRSGRRRRGVRLPGASQWIGPGQYAGASRRHIGGAHHREQSGWRDAGAAAHSLGCVIRSAPGPPPDRTTAT